MRLPKKKPQTRAFFRHFAFFNRFANPVTVTTTWQNDVEKNNIVDLAVQQFERLFEASLKSQFSSYQRMQGRGSGAQTERKMDVNPLEEALFGDSR